MAWRPHPKHSRTNARYPSGWGTCDRSGFVGQQKELINQVEYRGLRLMPTNVFVLPEYADIPQRQLGTIILSPDPLPILNARPEQYPADEIWPRLTQQGQPRYLQGSECSRSLQQSVYFNTSGKY